MTALELAAALLQPDSDLLPVTHERGEVVIRDREHYVSCTCGWWSLPYFFYSDAERDFHLHKTIHSYVHSEWMGWTRA